MFSFDDYNTSAQTLSLLFFGIIWHHMEEQYDKKNNKIDYSVQVWGQQSAVLQQNAADQNTTQCSATETGFWLRPLLATSIGLRGGNMHFSNCHWCLRQAEP